MKIIYIEHIYHPTANCHRSKWI